MTKCKNPEQILLMVAVIDHILHFVKSGRILFSMQAPMLHSATETNPRFEILYASIVAVTDNLSDQKLKVFFSPIFVSCLPVTVQDGIWICTDTDTARAAFSTLTFISWLQLKKFRPYFYGLTQVNK